MQCAAETIEEEFTLNVRSLEIFEKDFDLFRAGHANEIHMAQQRFAWKKQKKNRTSIFYHSKCETSGQHRSCSQAQYHIDS